MRKILLNLLGNASKFTEAGSVRLVVTYIADKSQLRFDVIDTGIGTCPDLTRNYSEGIRDEDIRLSGEILVADDRRDIRFLATRLLEKAGASTVAAG